LEIRLLLLVEDLQKNIKRFAVVLDIIFRVEDGSCGAGTPAGGHYGGPSLGIHQTASL